MEQTLTNDIAAYAGYLTDNAELLKTTSGGIATALSKRVIQAGGYVAGVSYSPDFHKAQYEIAGDESELLKFMGSKYVEADKRSIYKDVKALLDTGKTVLFFGLPCVVAAMKAYLKKEYDNLYTVELICHGHTSAEVHRQYVEHLEKKHSAKVVDFSVRKKKTSWMPPYLYVKLDNEKEIWKPFYHTEYGFAFQAMAKLPCYHCRFKGTARVADLMLGDFWGATPSDPFWNANGVSSILVRTEHGRELLTSTEGIALFETTVERIVEKNANVVRPRKADPKKEIFEARFQARGLFYAVKKTKSLKLKLLHRIPEPIKHLARKILKRNA